MKVGARFGGHRGRVHVVSMPGFIVGPWYNLQASAETSSTLSCVELAWHCLGTVAAIQKKDRDPRVSAIRRAPEYSMLLEESQASKLVSG
jgi:hypothetical protein